MTRKSTRMKSIKDEINWYGIRKTVADAMLELGEIGFESSGHGCGFGGEDFSLYKETKNYQLYVNFCDKGRSCVASIEVYNKKDDTDYFYEGTIGKVLTKIKNKYH